MSKIKIKKQYYSPSTGNYYVLLSNRITLVFSSRSILAAGYNLEGGYSDVDWPDNLRNRFSDLQHLFHSDLLAGFNWLKKFRSEKQKALSFDFPLEG